MEERILTYRKKIDAILGAQRAVETVDWAAQEAAEAADGGAPAAAETVDWAALEAEHLVQIGFFQHERLVHLLVTLAFALLAMMGISLCLLSPSIAVFALTILFFVLLVPYIRHYYILENETQKLYGQYDAIRKRQ